MPNSRMSSDIIVPWSEDSEAREARLLRAVFEHRLGEGGFTRRELAANLRRLDQCRYSGSKSNPESKIDDRHYETARAQRDR